MMDILNYSFDYKDNKSFKLFKTLCETYGDVVIENDYLTVTFKDGSEAKFGLKAKDIILKNFFIPVEQTASMMIFEAYSYCILKMIEDNQSIKDMTLVKTNKDTKELLINVFNGKDVNGDVFLSKRTSYSFDNADTYYYQPESGGVRFSYNFAHVPEFNTNNEHVIDVPITYMSYETEYPNIKVSPRAGIFRTSLNAARSTKDYYELIEIAYACSYYQDNVIFTGDTYNDIIGDYNNNYGQHTYPWIDIPSSIADHVSSVIIYDVDNLENVSYLQYRYDSTGLTYLNAYELTYYSYNMSTPKITYFVE